MMVGIAALAALAASVFDPGLIGLFPAVLVAGLTASLIPRGGWRSRLATLAAVVAVVAVPLAVAAVGSKLLWDHYFWPPEPDPRIVNARAVHRAGYVRTQAVPGGGGVFTFGPLGRTETVLASAKVDTFLGRTARVLVALNARGKLPEDPAPPSARRSSEVFPVLFEAEAFYEPSLGFTKSKILNGQMLEADASDGTPVVFISTWGDEVSAGKYPVYEFLFKGDLAKGPLELLSLRRCFVYVGVLQGRDWRSLFAVAAAAEALLLAVGVFAVQSVRSRKPAAAAPAEPAPAAAEAGSEPVA
ncbi:MAG: hypothetical protein U0835_23310 [Isosphaeraceae bacterium]